MEGLPQRPVGSALPPWAACWPWPQGEPGQSPRHMEVTQADACGCLVPALPKGQQHSPRRGRVGAVQRGWAWGWAGTLGVLHLGRIMSRCLPFHRRRNGVSARQQILGSTQRGCLKNPALGGLGSNFSHTPSWFPPHPCSEGVARRSPGTAPRAAWRERVGTKNEQKVLFPAPSRAASNHALLHIHTQPPSFTPNAKALP